VITLALTKAEKRKLKKQKRVEERTRWESKRRKKSTKRNVIVAGIVVIAVAFIVFSIVSNKQKPGYYDDFAKCLSEKGMVIYGASWCKYTAGQKQMFGKSAEYLNYKDYTETTGITTTPTWEFEGQRYPRAQSFERLNEISGCPLPSE